MTTPKNQRKALTPAQKANLFKPGHKNSNRRRTLREQIDENTSVAEGKRIKLAKHFGISDHSWKAIKEAAYDRPELVMSWDSGIRPKSPEMVVLKRSEKDLKKSHLSSRYDEFCRLIFQNVHMTSIEAAKKMHLDEDLARVWLSEVKETKRYRELAMRAEAEFEGSLQDLMQKSISVMRRNTNLPAKEYIGLLSQLMGIYKTLQDGKIKRETLISSKEAKISEEILSSALAVKLDLSAVDQKADEEEPDAPDFSDEGDI